MRGILMMEPDENHTRVAFREGPLEEFSKIAVRNLRMATVADSLTGSRPTGKETTLRRAE